MINSDMHRVLISYLIQKQLPVSIIIDAATDASQKHNLVVLVQTLENYKPVIYFYKFIKLLLMNQHKVC